VIWKSGEFQGDLGFLGRRSAGPASSCLIFVNEWRFALNFYGLLFQRGCTVGFRWRRPPAMMTCRTSNTVPCTAIHARKLGPNQALTWSLAPVLVLVNSIVGLVFGRDAAARLAAETEFKNDH
jgi:hypothetical protein